MNYKHNLIEIILGSDMQTTQNIQLQKEVRSVYTDISDVGRRRQTKKRYRQIKQIQTEIEEIQTEIEEIQTEIEEMQTEKEQIDRSSVKKGKEIFVLILTSQSL